MNIGFDLDKIFINHPPYISDKLVDRLYKQKTKENLFYRIPSKTEQLLRLATHAKTFRKPMKENIQFLEELTQKKNNRYYLVTGRFGFLKKKTEAFIIKYNFGKIFDGMYFNYDNQQPHQFKDTIIKYLHLDKYVDDDLDLLKYLSQNNSNASFFWFNKKNQEKLLTNLFAITKLQQIYE
ncbi:MAG TPA: hypothetical protein VLF89_00405 [Candidatus Saccharimonadales bacterium]|nr:hypothetical protein [Candidatus Saccharimonadales bacterium]